MRKVSFHPNQLLPTARQELAKERGDGFASDVASVQVMKKKVSEKRVAIRKVRLVGCW